MALQPKQTKYRKGQRRRLRGAATSGTGIHFGEFGLQALETGMVTGRQIEAARKALAHFLKRGGKVWIRIFPDKPMTARPAETRMGGGKGAPAYYVAAVKRGRMLFELGGVPEVEAREAFRLAGHKLSLSTRIVAKG